MKKEFSGLGVLAGAAEVSGRPIVIFELNRPVSYRNFVIPAIELLAPKGSDNYQNGPEHLEFVITESFDEFLEKYHGIEFETFRLERKNNPEIKLNFPNKTSLKFHKIAILEVLNIQKQTCEL